MSLTDDLYLIPAAGKTVRDPLTGQPLPLDGAAKPRTAYWLRRLRDGSVTAGTPTKAPKTSTPKGDTK